MFTRISRAVLLFPFNVRLLRIMYGRSLAARGGFSSPYSADIVLFTLALCKTQHFVYCDLIAEWTSEVLNSVFVWLKPTVLSEPRAGDYFEA